jgi:hypothetical protein
MKSVLTVAMSRFAKNFVKKHILRDLPEKSVRKWVERELEQRIVRSGPFQNMKYGERSRSIGLVHASAYYPKLLGTYELEIASFIRRIGNLRADRIVDVGAAEGYYAVGLALITNAQVVAFEAHGTETLLALATLNSVAHRITAHTICDAAGLRAAVDGASRAFVFMDIEGGESILLDPLVVPELSKAWIIVEVHDCFIPGTTELLKHRFATSHRIEEVWSRQRCPEDFPLQYHARWFDPSMYYLEYMGERSVKTNWLYLEPIIFGDQIQER